jgi:hypothetical protein
MQDFDRLNEVNGKLVTAECAKKGGEVRGGVHSAIGNTVAWPVERIARMPPGFR